MPGFVCGLSFFSPVHSWCCCQIRLTAVIMQHIREARDAGAETELALMCVACCAASGKPRPLFSSRDAGQAFLEAALDCKKPPLDGCLSTGKPLHPRMDACLLEALVTVFVCPRPLILVHPYRSSDQRFRSQQKMTWKCSRTRSAARLQKQVL
jgi:hypothetical protein